MRKYCCAVGETIRQRYQSVSRQANSESNALSETQRNKSVKA
jgi:hypothetical protein